MKYSLRYCTLKILAVVVELSAVASQMNHFHLISYNADFLKTFLFHLKQVFLSALLSVIFFRDQNEYSLMVQTYFDQDG